MSSNQTEAKKVPMAQHVYCLPLNASRLIPADSKIIVRETGYKPDTGAAYPSVLSRASGNFKGDLRQQNGSDVRPRSGWCGDAPLIEMAVPLAARNMV